ncbi:hypothetical protein [Chryseobacterium sp. ZHDP1]|uniref:hypothetical protein n=1 Tax=Chryseobacterium sp. ZHDP1 TaxID=2838877 RepID=UPI001BE0296E|nr:hypothetical protein [Chryseobacterium sp. ZHDP1]QWA38859.1 hypothetical protein KKI44_01205 [Chryseobacterium sp. ZHDP1]
MEVFFNNLENFFREIRSVEIYNADDVFYINAYNGIFPPKSKALYIFDELVPETFSRKISSKTRNGNPFTDIDVSFPLLDMSLENISKCEEYFNKKCFAVVFVANTVKTLLGNASESLRVDFIDNKNEDGSGNDEYTIAISGETILKPKLQSL